MRGYRRNTSADWIMYLSGGICLFLSLILVLTPYFSGEKAAKEAPVPTASSMINQLATGIIKSQSSTPTSASSAPASIASLMAANSQRFAGAPLALKPPAFQSVGVLGESPGAAAAQPAPAPGFPGLRGPSGLTGAAAPQIAQQIAQMMAGQQQQGLASMQEVMQKITEATGGTAPPMPDPVPPSEVGPECHRLLETAMKNRREIMASLNEQFASAERQAPGSGTGLQEKMLDLLQSQLGSQYCSSMATACKDDPEGLDCQNAVLGLTYARSLTQLGKAVEQQFKMVADQLDADAVHGRR